MSDEVKIDTPEQALAAYVAEASDADGKLTLA